MAADSIVNYVFTDHAKRELIRRGLSEQVIHAILSQPEQRGCCPPWEGRVAITTFDGRTGSTVSCPGVYRY